MKKYILFFVLLFTFFSLSACFSSEEVEEIDYNALEDNIRDVSTLGVVEIETTYASGVKKSLGAIVSSSGSTYRVIAYYNLVVITGATYKIKTSTGNTYVGSLVDRSLDKKLALIEFVADNSDGLYTFPLSNNQAYTYDIIAGIGTNNTIYFGSAYEAATNDSLGIRVFRHNVQISKLNETGIIIDTDNRLLGLNIASSTIATNGKVSNYAIPVSDIKSFL